MVFHLSYANKSFYIPVGHKNVKGLNKDLVLKKLKNFEDPSIKKVGQNIKYDFLYLKIMA